MESAKTKGKGEGEKTIHQAIDLALGKMQKLLSRLSNPKLQIFS
jgi:hypothetical protein